MVAQAAAATLIPERNGGLHRGPAGVQLSAAGRPRRAESIGEAVCHGSEACEPVQAVLRMTKVVSCLYKKESLKVYFWQD